MRITGKPSPAFARARVVEERLGSHFPSSASVHACICLVLLLFSGTAVFSQAQGKVIVHSKFGGQIFGFDIDQNGTEGILSESQTLDNGHVLAAVETFDQRTRKILAVVAKTETADDFVTLGIVGNSVGLVEHEIQTGPVHVTRKYQVLDPLNSNQFTGAWTPPLGRQDIIMPNGVSRSQGMPNVAVFVYDNSGQFTRRYSVLTWDQHLRSSYQDHRLQQLWQCASPIAYDSVTNQAVLGRPGCFFCRPEVGVADLMTGTFSEFIGVGFGFINGIAVDGADGIVVTTTEDDANVEFYDLATRTGFTVQLPQSGGEQFFSGADVEFDPIHKLFFVAQPNSSVSSGSTIYVYDIHGVLQKTLNGFKFSNTFNIIPMHVALNPSRRAGFVDGPDQGVTQIQSFIY